MNADTKTCNPLLFFELNTDWCQKLLVSSFYRYDELFISNPTAPLFRPEWSCLQYPLSVIAAGGQAIAAPGALRVRVSRDGQLVAVVVNQMDTRRNRVVFVSPWTDTMVVSDLKGCGLKQPITSIAARSVAVNITTSMSPNY